MEKICEHCNELFTAKRKDVVYCSASCRQMAYMERRYNTVSDNTALYGKNAESYSYHASSHNPSIDGLSEDETSIDVSKKQIEPSIDVLENGTQSNKPNTSFINETSPDFIDEEPIREYQEVSSKFLETVTELINQRDYITVLNNCIYIHRNAPSQSVGIRLKCLAECLLLFSEMKWTEIEDLKEICNAFTLTISSRHYKELIDTFPYKSYIVSLRDRLKKLIVENRKEEKVQFRLSTENKIELIATRHELSYFCTKKKFCDLNFEE